MHYLSSLDKVAGLQVDLVLPGHRRLIMDHQARIEELKNHHALRLQEVLTILRRGAMTAFQVAARMTWDLNCDHWNDFPVAQKWFATGEAISHLRFLEDEGKVRREVDDKLTKYAFLY